MIKTNTSYSINKAVNGFIAEKSWVEMVEGSEFNKYNSEKNVFSSWEDVSKYISDNTL